MKKIIEINDPVVEKIGTKIAITYNVKLHSPDSIHFRNIWFKADYEQSGSISKLANGIMVGMLPLALKEGYDMIVNSPVDPLLVHNINQYVIPILCENDSRFYKPIIEAKKFGHDVSGDDVGTGLSLGVDSFTTIHDYKNINNKEFVLTDLIVFNMYGNISKKIRELTREVGSKIALPVFYYESNICTAMDNDPLYIPCHTFFMASIILTLGINHKRYLFSSGVSFNQINTKKLFDGHIVDSDVILLPYLGTNSLHFYSAGGQYSRSQKTRIVAFDKIGSEYVTPCLHNFEKNCGWCFKCKRTMVTADVGGYIDRLSNVFDVENYKQNRKAYLFYLYESRDEKELEGVYDTLKKKEPGTCSQIEKEFSIYRKKYSESPDWFASVAAESGNVDAKMRLAKLYFDGRSGYGVEPKSRATDYKTAISLAKDCMKSSDENLLFYIKCLMNGTDDEKRNAYEICKKEANDKPPFAKQLSIMMHYGIGTEVNDIASLKYGLIGCENDCDRVDLIKMFMDVDSNNINVVEELMAIGKQLDSEDMKSAVARARLIYHHSNSSTSYEDAKSILIPYMDFEEAADLLTNMMIEKEEYGEVKKICEKFAYGGSSLFQYKLAQCHINGWGCDSNIDEAINLLSTLVIIKKETWHTTLLVKLLLKRGTKADQTTAFNIALARSKINPKDGSNQGLLGRMYRDGVGTPKSIDRAVDCLYAARMINSNWINELADLLIIRNKGIDLSQAYIMSIKKAIEGDVWCQLRLHNMYKRGIFVERNESQSKFWARIAALSGNKVAVNEYNSLSKDDEEPEKYDIGLVTFWFANNYGAILTAFALYHHLENEGYKVLMIEKPAHWWPAFDETKDPLARTFAKKYLKLSLMYTPETLSELNDICESFIVGSDQMWNYHLYETAGNYTYLDFTKDDKKRLAYSTSFGHTRFLNDDPKVISEVKSLMKRFDSISTREETGIEVCKNLFDVDATCNLDSVFLCSKDVYDAIADEDPIITKPDHYIFAYILDGDKEIERILNEVANILQLELIVVIDGGDVVEKKEIDMTFQFKDVTYVGEWLDYVRFADFVVTDSFHGSCFSIIFNRQFIAIRNEGRGGTRFDSILGKAELMDRMIDKSTVDRKQINGLCETLIDYNEVNLKINRHIQKSKEWLKDNLNPPSIR